MEQPSDFRWLALIRNSLSNKLPNDIVLDILVRLPVKSIFRFKCVSKLWCSVFSHPNFIVMHLNKAISGNNCLLFRHMVLEEKEVNVWRVHQEAGSSESDIVNAAEDHEVDPDPSTHRLVYQGKLWNERERFSLRSKENVEEVGILQVPTPSTTSYYSLVGCFNGLICINESNFSDTYHTLNMSLWNPATREFRCLPRYFTRRLSDSLLVVGLGFGHEPITDDYKIVRFIYFIHSKTYEAETYSLRRNCWKRISAENIYSCYFPQHVPQATTNGALHWMVYRDRDYANDTEFIIAFDIDKEKLSKISVPSVNLEDQVSHICKRVSVFQDQLALFTHFPLAEDQTFSIWVMKEYGNVGSWTRLYSVNQEELMIPLHFVGNDLVIMKRKRDGQMVLGDVRFRKIRDLNVSSWCRVTEYVESLVSPKAGRGRDGRELTII